MYSLVQYCERELICYKFKAKPETFLHEKQVRYLLLLGDGGKQFLVL